MEGENGHHCEPTENDISCCRRCNDAKCVMRWTMTWHMGMCPDLTDYLSRASGKVRQLKNIFWFSPWTSSADGNTHKPIAWLRTDATLMQTEHIGNAYAAWAAIDKTQGSHTKNRPTLDCVGMDTGMGCSLSRFWRIRFY